MCLMLRRTFLLFTLSVALYGAEPFFLKDGQRVVFLGDSITQGGTYVEYVEAYLLTSYPAKKFDVIKLGLSSETVCGLTEPDHPYPRPNVHDRVDSALQKTKPNVVVINYGMNDGIYHPFSKERFQAYQEGIRKLIAKIKEAGAVPVALTPSMFDVLPKGSAAVDINAKQFGYKTPYKEYDSVLEAYGKWLMSLRKEGLMVIDAHKPMLDYTRKQRKTDPNFTLAKDGVHPGPLGHWIMAESILKAWGAPKAKLAAFKQAVDSGKSPEAPVFAQIQEKWKLMGPAWLYRVGHKRNPKPVDFEAAQAQAVDIEKKVREIAKQPAVR